MKGNSLKPADKVVLMALQLLVNKQIHPITRQLIADISGVTPRTVTTSIERLQIRRIIAVERHGGKPNLYTIMESKC